MDKVNKQELRRLAEAATRGPWRACGHDRGGCSCGMIWSRAADLPVAEAWRGDEEAPEPPEGAKANAIFIAEANPAAILSLLDELERVYADRKYCWEEFKAMRRQADENERSLREELEQCRKDAERLDWLTEKGKQEDSGQGDVRAYIDAAMAKEGGANG